MYIGNFAAAFTPTREPLLTRSELALIISAPSVFVALLFSISLVNIFSFCICLWLLSSMIASSGKWRGVWHYIAADVALILNCPIYLQIIFTLVNDWSWLICFSSVGAGFRRSSFDIDPLR